MRSGIVTVIDRVDEVGKAIEQLVGSRAMVGYPASGESRPTALGGEHITNAALAYIHENGAPEAHIPPRPFLEPGIKRIQDKLSMRLRKAAEAALAGEPAKVDRYLAAAGQEAASSAQNVISGGIPPPLANSTLEGRIARHKHRIGERRELLRRGKGLGAGSDTIMPASTELAKPLIDTGELIQHLTYAVRKAPGTK